MTEFTDATNTTTTAANNTAAGDDNLALLNAERLRELGISSSGRDRKKVERLTISTAPTVVRRKSTAAGTAGGKAKRLRRSGSGAGYNGDNDDDDDDDDDDGTDDEEYNNNRSGNYGSSSSAYVRRAAAVASSRKLAPWESTSNVDEANEFDDGTASESSDYDASGKRKKKRKNKSRASTAAGAGGGGKKRRKQRSAPNVQSSSTTTTTAFGDDNDDNEDDENNNNDDDVGDDLAPRLPRSKYAEVESDEDFADDDRRVYREQKKAAKNARAIDDLGEAPEVEKIERVLDRRVSDENGEYEYLVKWEGWAYMHATWLSESLLKDYPGNKILQNFIKNAEYEAQCRATWPAEDIEALDVEKQMFLDQIEQ